ncbi:MAG TPA: penicillin-binding protein activator [Nevskiales bacterium]|nr:penicillin-binding protein activator [Nevskiales bacterium]
MGLVLLLAAAAPWATAAPPRTAAQVEADERYADGDYAGAAEIYLQAATLVPPPDRTPLLIRAAEAALRAERRDLASQTLQKIDASQLTPAERLRADLLLASLGRLPGGPPDWLQRLPPPGKDADADLAERLLAVRAEAYLRQGEVVEAVRTLVQRESWLERREARVRNQAQIWNALRTAPSIGTQHQTRNDLDSVTRGWLELAMLQRAVWSDPAERADALDAWEWRYPDHPAADTVLDLVRGESRAIAQAQAATPAAAEPVPLPASLQTTASVAPAGPVRVVALILPLSGALAGAGRAVRDGFLAAWFEQPTPRPRVRVYDGGSSPDRVLAVYERALAAGADLVVGPLSKEAVATLARMVTPTRPLLALNYLEPGQPAPANFYQFGLAPEDEARQAADRALADGHRRAVALVPEGDWGRRTLEAFRERFEGQGGSLLDVQTFAPGLQDFSEPVRRLLKLEDSAQRKQALDAVLGAGVQFSASPGDLPDFVFIAAQPQQARLIRPQFRFLGAGQLPLYATSLVYEGSAAPARDADLEDIRFCDMPFLLATGEEAAPRERIRGLWPETYPRHPRLYAFGFDAARLALRLGEGGGRDYSGVTGHLRLSEDGRVRRSLLWAEFRGGRARLLDGVAAATP